MVPALAIVGLLLSAYLTSLHYSGAGAAFCPSGSGCDLVQSSRYSRALGIPVAVLGIAGYALILAVSLLPLRQTTKWLALFLVIVAGFTYSAYLTYLELAVIGAVCFYCVLSALTMTAILALVLLRRPLVPSWASRSLLALTAGVAALTLAAGVLATPKGPGQPPPGETSGYATALAQYLSAEGVIMYGAYWCSHCQEQKDLFGDAFQHVRYVECDPEGQNAQPLLCLQRGIRAYPTWEIQGRPYEGVLSLTQLARLSGFSP